LFSNIIAVNSPRNAEGRENAEGRRPFQKLGERRGGDWSGGEKRRKSGGESEEKWEGEKETKRRDPFENGSSRFVSGSTHGRHV
jgi:hypothetical protein